MADDAESGVIVVAGLTNVAPDVGHLPELVTRVRSLREAAGRPEAAPTTVSADDGYFSGDNAAEEGRGLDLLIAIGRDDPAAAGRKPGVYSVECFGYDVERDVWVCPADQLLLPQVPLPGERGRPSQHRYLADPVDCAACPLRTQCLKPGDQRRVLDAQRRRQTGAMRFKLRQPAARRRYARRKVIVEPVFGQLKRGPGLHHPQPARAGQATGGYLLACLAHNLGKLLRVCALPAMRPAATA